MSYTITGGMSAAAYTAQVMKRAKAIAEPFTNKVAEDAKAGAGEAMSGGQSLIDAISAPEISEEDTRLTIDIWCRAAHAAYAEFGRGPGKRPPTSALLPWIEKVWGLSGKEAESAAFVLARKIGESGTAPLFFMSSAIWANEDDFASQLKAEFES
jgi:hypothetical protein